MARLSLWVSSLDLMQNLRLLIQLGYLLSKGKDGAPDSVRRLANASNPYKSMISISLYHLASQEDERKGREPMCVLG